jgi:hypothetical protein
MAILYQPLKINGVISTDKSVLQNLNDLCSASGCWLTYDYSEGKWSVIINRPGTTIANFNDSNIIGNIDISGTGVTELYNSVSIEFPHKDLRDEKDYVDLEVPSNQRFPNEVDNTLNIQLDCINDPVQAQYLASVELNQSRVDKIIEFRTDYSKVGLKAGDLISVTNSIYGYNNKVFRIVKLVEDDSDGLSISITALEYNAGVYTTTGLVRNERTKKTGILLRSMNPAVQQADTVNFGNQMLRMLAANVGLGLLNKLFSRKIDSLGNITDLFEEPDTDAAKVLNKAKVPNITTITGPTFVCEGQTATITVGHNCTSCFFDVPDKDYDYTITGVEAADITIPLTGKVTVSAGGSGGIGTLAIGTVAGQFVGNKTIAVTIGNLSRSVIVYEVGEAGYVTSASPTSITEGASSTVTVTTTDVPNGTVVPYAITGTATGKVTTPLTGNITINNNTASLVINTTDDSVFTGTQSLTFTINPGGAAVNPCSGNDLTATISVLDNDPAPAADKTCVYTLVPAVWCAIYDGADDQMKGVTVRRSVYLPVAQAGEATVNVPTSLTITKGNPSTVTIANTVAVASSSSLGGQPIQIITSFNSVSPLGLITGTTTTVYGYFL